MAWHSSPDAAAAAAAASIPGHSLLSFFPAATLAHLHSAKKGSSSRANQEAIQESSSIRPSLSRVSSFVASSLPMKPPFPRIFCCSRPPPPTRLSRLLIPPPKHHQQRGSWARAMTNSKEKLVVIMGATGTGKSRLSIDLASRFQAEVINADKIQLYRGLDITTNKITPAERRGVPHHLLGELDPAAGELSPRGFRTLADSAAQRIASRRSLPILAGGSNSLIHALLAADPPSSGLRYDCCFLWVDVAVPVLFDYLNKRVDVMLDLGMAQELEQFNDPLAAAAPPSAIRRAIGVPEFDAYFSGEAGFEDSVEAIKENTRQLALRQIGKIQRLRMSAGWDLHRMDGSEVFRRVLDSDRAGSTEAWEMNVLEPSVKIVKRFLENDHQRSP